jgi:soluble lytic murein transglycosylase-like protein
MRRLALLLALGTVAVASAGAQDLVAFTSGNRPAARKTVEPRAQGYLRLRTQHNVVQAVGVAAIREVVKPRVFELQGKVVGTCRAGDTTVLLFQRADGDTQEVEAKALPDWLATTTDPVRLLVRCTRTEKGAALKTTYLGAAHEIDVLPAEEAYWRRQAAQRKAVAPARKAASSTISNRGGLYGPIGSRRATAARRDWVLPVSDVTPRYAAFIRGRNPRLRNDEALRIAEAIIGFSLRYRVDARLVMAMLIVESDFDPNAVSRSGAIGLGQLMPGTARWMGVRNSYDTTDNLYGTVKLLRTHLNQYRTPDGSDLALVLAAYNAGSGAVSRHGGVPPYRETQAYVRKVTAIYRKLCGY